MREFLPAERLPPERWPLRHQIDAAFPRTRDLGFRDQAQCRDTLYSVQALDDDSADYAGSGGRSQTASRQPRSDTTFISVAPSLGDRLRSVICTRKLKRASDPGPVTLYRAVGRREPPSATQPPVRALCPRGDGAQRLDPGRSGRDNLRRFGADVPAYRSNGVRGKSATVASSRNSSVQRRIHRPSRLAHNPLHLHTRTALLPPYPLVPNPGTSSSTRVANTGGQSPPG